MSLEDDMEDLESAEDFLNYFELPFDAAVVHVNRLHILQRFHNYLQQASEQMPEGPETKHQVCKQLLLRAYQDFEQSDAQTEKVFKVFKMMEPQSVFVALGDIQT